MNKEQYFAYHQDFCDRMQTITQKKNSDYTGDSDDPFANFTAVEKLGICSTEVGFLVRMTDKLVRMSNLIDGRDPAVADESLADTIHDLSNYGALLSGYIESKRSKQQESAFQALSYFTQEIENTDPVPSERNWPYGPLPTERSFEIIARDNKGEEVTLELCPDLTLAQNRLDHYRDQWPTFKLRIEEVDDGYSEVD